MTNAAKESGSTKKYFKLRVAVYLVLKRDNEILLLLRQGTGYADGFYSVVSGHLNGQECASDAMIRESFEEAGIIIAPEHLKFALVIHRNAPDREYVDFFYTCEKWQNEVCNMEPDKCGELKFFPIDHLPENMIGYVRQALIQITANNPYYEHGWKDQ